MSPRDRPSADDTGTTASSGAAPARDQVWIVTRSAVHVDAVVERLRARGLTPVVLYTNHLPTQARLTIRADGTVVVRCDPDAEPVALDRLRSVWYRRFEGPRLDGLPDEPGVRKAVVGAVRALVYGALAKVDAPVLQPKARLEAADARPRQLAAAQAVGLDVPATLISQDADAIRAFVTAHGGQAITKSFSKLGVVEGSQAQAMRTTVLDPAAVATLSDDELRWCPMVVQECLDIAEEHRCYVIGRCYVGSARLTAEDLGEDKVDWRRQGLEVLPHWRASTLPGPVARGLEALCDRLALDYAAIDVIHTTDGRWVFLEANPAGELDWIDRRLDGALYDAIADWLAEPPTPRGGRWMGGITPVRAGATP